MIRFRLAELMAEHSFGCGHRVEWREVAQATGIHRTTLSKMLNLPGYNATVSNVDLLCRFFGCNVGDLLVYVADENVPGFVHTTLKNTDNKTDAVPANELDRGDKRKVLKTTNTPVLNPND